MNGYIKYFNYVLRHKWYVFVECMKFRIPLQGIFHDASKFMPDEFIPYAQYFYGSIDRNTNNTGYFHKNDKNTSFNKAWLKHQKRNKHHWQHWILREDTGDTILLPMPLKYMKEMLADWRGAGKAQGYGDNTIEWYEQNKDRMMLHPSTRKWIEDQLYAQSKNTEKE